MLFRNVQRQLPEMWIMSRGTPVTLRQTKNRYNLRTEEETERMLNNLVREGRLVTMEVDGVIMWDVKRRPASHVAD